MKYLFDTDHLSILQRRTGYAYVNLLARISQQSLSEFAVSIVSFHEQTLGAHAYLNRVSDVEKLIQGYDRLELILSHFKVLTVLPFDRAAAKRFSDLLAQQVRGTTMDLRIAAIALSRDLTLLTRNQRDFVKVPGLKLEDWTIAPEGE
jgi:tRNA(fMet)-specific endonuclease VapC